MHGEFQQASIAAQLGVRHTHDEKLLLQDEILSHQGPRAAKSEQFGNHRQDVGENQE